MTLHIGTVPYCNAFPLTHFLPEYLPDAVISDWYPSAMRERLDSRSLDLALMPVAELLPSPRETLPRRMIISNCCIACNGTVRSVLLCSRKPIEHIRTIALDTASRSSVKICELILRHFFGLQPEKYRLETNQNPGDCLTDAFVIIGDRALAYQPSGCWDYCYDVGELWKDKTGLPLVFAAWVGHSPDADLASALEASRDQGIQNLETILDAKHQQGITLPPEREQILDYYRRAIVYTMGEEVHAGLQCFFELASKESYLE